MPIVITKENALDALDLTREDMLELAKKKEQRIAELEAALRPFASAAYNDNGDVTISTGHIRTEDWLRAKRAIFN